MKFDAIVRVKNFSQILYCFCLDYITLQVNSNVLEGKACGSATNGLGGNVGQAGTTGHFHVNDGKAPGRGGFDYGGEFFDIELGVIQFRAANRY